ncbi:cobalamin biosynthesis protein CobG [Palleronia rufa]|uniref:cobalamin biosynthesis protein CobG n=1 Tax=Palleronia rufa TaxID=1530186 RepID=UPI00068B1CDF|nr:cobalamin biosynthesis protein CobG [Palleronia rufa]
MTGAVRGWCPGAWRPMMSGDGLVVRVRPRLGRLACDAALGLGEIAARHGSGVIELTRRGNVQIRGVSPAAHDAVLTGLNALGLLDTDPETEARRNILVQPFWAAGDTTHRLGHRLHEVLADLPDLPAKFGLAVDTGAAPILGRDPADIRVERAASGLIVRADGAATGRAVLEEGAVPAMLDLARWFAANRGDTRRMSALLDRAALPDRFAGAPPLPPAAPPRPGPTPHGSLAGVPFGQIEAPLWTAAARAATALRITPWRMLVLEGADTAPEGLITRPDDPILAVDACPGAPFCASASVETRSVARALAGRVASLHVSGCAKGCARSRPAAVTLVGRDGRFDLVTDGRAGDIPTRRGLTPVQVADAL